MLRRRVTYFMAAGAVVAVLVGCSVSSPELRDAPPVTTGDVTTSTTLVTSTTVGGDSSSPPSIATSEPDGPD